MYRTISFMHCQPIYMDTADTRDIIACIKSHILPSNTYSRPTHIYTEDITDKVKGVVAIRTHSYLHTNVPI